MRALLSVTQVLGRLLLVFSLTYLMPIACALIYRDGTLTTFLDSMLACIAVGLVLILATRRHRAELKARDGFILVTLAWTLTAAIATVPLMLAPGHVLHGLLLRDHVRAHHHGGHGDDGARYHGAIHQPLASCPQLAGGHGDHRPGGGHPAPAGGRRHAAPARRGPWPHQGHQTHRPHRRHRGHPLDRVSGHHHRLHPGPQAGRDGLVRCHLPRLRGAQSGRLLHPRRQHRGIRLGRHRGGLERLHGDRGAQLRHPLYRLARAQPATLLAGRRGEGGVGPARSELSWPVRPTSGAWGLTRASGRPCAT